MQLVNTKVLSSHARYSDGYDDTYFTFDTEVSREEFETFCKENGYSLEHKGENWYDGDVIFYHPEPNVWKRRVTIPYTD